MLKKKTRSRKKIEHAEIFGKQTDLHAGWIEYYRNKD